MTYTSIEQSKALMHLGLDEKTADMYYQQTEDAIDCWEVHIGKKDAQNELPQISCWSSEALLDILPDEVYIEEEDDTAYLAISKEDCTYIVSYDSKLRLDERLVFIDSMGEDLANVLFKVIEWLLTNKLI